MTDIARITISPSAAELIDLRHRLRGSGVLDELVRAIRDDVMLLVSELATNAIEAARPGSPITVELVRDAEQICVSVENFGPPFLLPHPVLPSSPELRGRGLAIAATLSDALHSDHHDGRTRVIAVRRFADGA